VKGRVFDVQRCCVHDGPGIRTTVFLAGCPLRCAWCHNPEAFSGQTARSVEAREVLREVLEDRAFYEATGGGLTVSGGEPLLQAPFVVELCAGARAAGLHTCLQTSGAVDEAALRAVLEVVDLVQFDLKHLDPARHLALTGRGNEGVLANAALAASGARQVEFRVPIVPGLTDAAEDLARTAAFVRGLGVGALHLVPYQRTYLGKYAQLGLLARCEQVEPPSPAAMHAHAAEVERHGLAARIAG